MDTDSILERLTHLDTAIKGKVEGGWWVIDDAKKIIAAQAAEIDKLRALAAACTRYDEDPDNTINQAAYASALSAARGKTDK